MRRTLAEPEAYSAAETSDRDAEQASREEIGKRYIDALPGTSSSYPLNTLVITKNQRGN